MADSTDKTLDDVYDDPDNILADDDDDVDGAAEIPASQKEDPSQSIYTPEKNTTPLDDRGAIDELEASDAEDKDSLDDLTDEALLDDSPADFDPDDYQLGDVNPADEQDGTEN